MTLIIIIFAALSALAEITAGSHELKFKTVQANWTIAQTKVKIDGITANNRDGSIFISSKGDIFSYSRNQSAQPLVEIYSLRANRKENPIPPIETTKLLQIIKVNDEEKLLSCWQAFDYELTCGLLDTTTHEFSLLSWARAEKNLTFGTSDEEYIVALPNDKGDNVLITTQVNLETERNQVPPITDESSSTNVTYNLPSLAKFKLATKTKQLNLSAMLPFRAKTLEPSKRYGYVYMFNHGDYTYFVFNEISKTGNYKLDCRAALARICKNDTELTSYAEIEFNCGDMDHLFAKMAYFDASQTEPTLHVIFEGLHRDVSERMAHCSYSLNEAQESFDSEVRKCHLGDPKSRLISRFHNESDGGDTLLCQSSSVQDFCTSTSNHYIGGATNSRIVGKEHFYLEDVFGDVNFLLSLTQGPSNASEEREVVLFVGYKRGYLTKYIVKLKKPLFTIFIEENKLVKYHYDKLSYPAESAAISGRMWINQETQYTFARETIIAINKFGQIHELPVDSCQYYTTCLSCLASQDSLGCVWCDNSCQNACDKLQTNDNKQSARVCPPYIRDIVPLSGPLGGNTTVTIVGEGLGGSSRAPRVLVGDKECSIIKESSDDFSIQCIVPSVSSSTSTLISLSQPGYSKYNVALEGKTYFSIPYEYKDVHISKVKPQEGPLNGETLINVTGSNLNVGSKRTIRFGENNCLIFRVEPEQIQCVLGPFTKTPSIFDYLYSVFYPQKNRSENVYLPLEMIIDGAVQPAPFYTTTRFAYKV